MKKQFVAIFLAALMVFGLSIPAMAAEGEPSVAGYYDAATKTLTIKATGVTGSVSAINVFTASGSPVKLLAWNASDLDGTNYSSVYENISLRAGVEYKVRLGDGVMGDIIFGEAPIDPEAKTYTVTFVDGEKKTEVVVEEGKTFDALNPEYKEGYTFDGWYLGEEKYDFTKPVTGDITLTAKWTEEELPKDTPVTILVDLQEVLKEDGTQYKVGETFVLPGALDDTADETFVGWLVNGELKKAGESIVIKHALDIHAKFDPKTPVTPDDGKDPVAPVGPSGKPTDPGTTDPEQPGTDPTQPGSVSSIFTDVDGHWAVNNGAIQYVYDNKLMTGATATSFAPNATTTRAQIFVILARRAGVDTEGGSIWYQKGLDWMVANNYSDGTNPNSAITRQELAALLYRVIGAPEVTGDLAAYPDASAVSDWAVNGMLWATQNGIISGNETGALNPQDNATRAQVATILMRFCQQYPVQAPAAE